ncbi:hypothetical protein AXZ77_1139 [Thioclava sp. ES.031]|uniref:hypothetical protein n=1 Tax=Thioclava sp. ES.031 TaxID=1798203 RepID=UPI000C013750|nr:hypothetical protein [Thioclava sp. ES.031]PFG62555.1 hypothetical protein AXZ77_1139 [Thioclava sp. ES.031]
MSNARQVTHRLSMMLGVLVLVGLCANVIGWATDNQALVRWGMDGAAMMPSTAASLGLLFMAALILLGQTANRRLARICALCAATIASGNLAFELTGLSDLDHFLSNRAPGDRMSISTIFGILLGAVIILELAHPLLGHSELPLTLAMSGLVSILAIFGIHNFQQGSQAGTDFLEAMSLYTAVSFVLLFVIFLVMASRSE